MKDNCIERNSKICLLVNNSDYDGQCITDYLVIDAKLSLTFDYPNLASGLE